jgi:hypothetical protein
MGFTERSTECATYLIGTSPKHLDYPVTDAPEQEK